MKNVNTRNFAYPSNRKLYGKSFAYWTELWTKWLLSIPKKYNPAIDRTGEHWNVQQEAPILFLAGTFGGSVKRKCYIPDRTPIFFPIIVKECSLTEDYDIKQESDLVERARRFIDCVTSMDVVIDGNKLQGLSTCRASSNIFDLRFPEDNVYDVEPGPTRSVADGYWIFMRRISPGKHVLSFRAEVSLPRNSMLVQLAQRYNKITGTIFKIEVLYDLIVGSNE